MQMSNLTKPQKKLTAIAAGLALSLGILPAAHAMHIMEGYLPPAFCIAWGVICLPFLLAGFFTLRNTVKKNRRAMTLIAISGAFVFVISSLKIPSVTGSCSHMTGTGLGAILFGPLAVSILGIIVLLFQALLLGHGGLTTLGANCFSMAVAGPLVTFLLYQLLKKCGLNKKVNIFIAAADELDGVDLGSGCILTLANPSEVGGVGASFAKFLAVFAPTQIPLAVIEGILTVVIIIALESFAAKELKSIGFVKEA